MTDEGKRLTREELLEVLQETRAQYRVHAGSVFEHNKSGAMYVVKGVALQEKDLSPVVIYSPWEDNESMARMHPVFTRPAAEFAERFTLRRI